MLYLEIDCLSWCSTWKLTASADALLGNWLPQLMLFLEIDCLIWCSTWKLTASADALSGNWLPQLMLYMEIDCLSWCCASWCRQICCMQDCSVLSSFLWSISFSFSIYMFVWVSINHLLYYWCFFVLGCEHNPRLPEGQQQEALPNHSTAVEHFGCHAPNASLHDCGFWCLH